MSFSNFLVFSLSFPNPAAPYFCKVFLRDFFSLGRVSEA